MDQLEENLALRKQNLRLSIQIAMLSQQVSAAMSRANIAVNELRKAIPNQSQVRGWVRDETDRERKKVQGLRDEAIIALKQIKESANA